MPGRNTERLFALASCPEGVCNNGGVRLASDAGVFSISAWTWRIQMFLIVFDTVIRIYSCICALPFVIDIKIQRLQVI